MKQRTRISDLTVRDFRLEDYGNVLRLWAEAGLPFRPQGRDRRDKVAAELVVGKAVFLVAETAGTVAGTVLGTHDGRKGWINRLAVAPAFRRLGIASMLVGEVEARLAELGIDITAALIEADNQGSLEFFQRIGYVRDERIEYLSKRPSGDT